MTTSPTTLQGGTERRQRRRRWPAVVLLVLLVVVVAALVADHVETSYWAEVPGVAQPVTGLIKVPQSSRSRLHGRVLLTDVGVYQGVSALQYLFDQFDSTTTLVPAADFTGGLPVAEANAEGTVEMQEAQATAKAVALRQLGYKVPERDVGVTIFAIVPGTPAYKALKVGDVVTAVDGTPTTNPTALVAAIRSHQPGQVVDLSVGTVAAPTTTHQVQVRLAAQRQGGVQRPVLGIPYSAQPYADGMGTQAAYGMPLHLTLHSDQIGGPSAGLAFTLGIIDELAGGDITGGRVVAATGTIDPNGAVGEIGGLPQKTVAVERAGASVFLVPAAQVAQAKAHATAGLTVIGVTSLHQALVALQRLGGHLGAAAAGPPAGPAGHAVPAQWQSSPWS